MELIILKIHILLDKTFQLRIICILKYRHIKIDLEI